VKSNGILCIR